MEVVADVTVADAAVLVVVMEAVVGVVAVSVQICPDEPANI